MQIASDQIRSPSYQPLYNQIKTLITQSLIGNEWVPGQMIPSEMDLAVRYKVSQGTVRKAIDSLAAENILIRKQGKGTFVATHQQDEIQRRFLRLTSAAGDKESLEATLLSCHQTKANAQVAQALNIKLDAPVIVVKRLLTFSSKPLIHDEIVVPADSFEGLDTAKTEASGGSMYSMYETVFGVRMVRAEEKLKAVSASTEIADALSIQQGVPLLSIERISYTYGNQPMEWRLGFCLTDNHHYMSELE